MWGRKEKQNKTPEILTHREEHFTTEYGARDTGEGLLPGQGVCEREDRAPHTLRKIQALRTMLLVS